MVTFSLKLSHHPRLAAHHPDLPGDAPPPPFPALLLFPFSGSLLASPQLLSLSRSLRSLNKECLTTLLQSTASALFFKTPGCHIQPLSLVRSAREGPLITRRTGFASDWMYSEVATNRVEAAPDPWTPPRLALDGGAVKSLKISNCTVRWGCGRAALLASIALLPFSAALSASTLISSDRVAARPYQDAADLRSAKESFDAGDYLSAKKTLQAVLEKSAGDPEIHFWLGRCSYELFDFNSAAASFDRAIQLQPKSSLYHQWLGRTYSEKADRERSLSLARKVKKEFQSAVQLDPANISARRDLAEYEMDAPWIAGGDKDDARKQVEAISALDPVEGSLARAMYILHAEKKTAQAEEIYRQVLQQKPQRIQPYFDVARFFQHYGRAADLEMAIQGAAAIDASDPRLDYFRGVTLFLEGKDLTGAERLLTKYISGAPQRSNWPFHADAREWLGRALEAEGKRTEAIAQYREALRLDPRSKFAHERVSKLEKSSD
jgi:tetratricopeptide (TPR) repeat protein